MNSSIFTALSEQIWSSGPRREDLVARVSSAVREQILAGEIAPGTRFLPETEMARRLCISRPSLREAIRILSREGLVTVRHGIGTFVTNRSKHMLGSLELMRSMTDLIRGAGGEPASRDLRIQRAKAPSDIAEMLAIQSGQQIGHISRVRLIDDLPFVYANEYVVLDDSDRAFSSLENFDGGSLYAFLRETFRLKISHSSSRISAVSATPSIAKMLQLEPKAPLLLMQEVHFGMNGRPELLAVTHHNTRVVEFTSMRSGMHE